MKHKIVTTICLVGILALVTLGVATWHTQQVQERIKAARAFATQQLHDARQEAAVAAEKKRVSDSCHQDQALYDAQSLSYRKAHVRPLCDLKIVE